MTVRTLLALVLISVPVSAQSLWRESRIPMGYLITDNTASQVGDVLTVIVRERQQIQDDEERESERNSQMDFSTGSFNLLPNAFDPLPSMQYGSTRSFEGKSDFQRNGRFESRLSATVVDVQPNGNLVIEGKRIIRIGPDTKTIRVSGIVRPLDVLPNNTILSESVANAEIVYESQGPALEASSPGWFHILLDIIWPF